MRAPSQVHLESAAAYAVTSPFTIAGVRYERGKIVGGGLARSWATFRALLGCHWLIPVIGQTQPTPTLTLAKLRRSKSA